MTPGQRVVVEAVITRAPDYPHGPYTIHIAPGTDDARLTDGVTAVVPQAIVHKAEWEDDPRAALIDHLVDGWVNPEGWM